MVSIGALEDISWFAFSSSEPAFSFPPKPYRAAGTTQSATSVATTDALLEGSKWSGDISYSFPDSFTDYETGYAEASNGFASISFDQMQAARQVLEGSARLPGGPRATLMPVEGFTDASLFDAGFGNSDIRIGASKSAGDTAHAFLPSSNPYGGDVWFGRAHDYTSPRLGTYEFATVIHELGHALGLKHAHESGGVSGLALPANRNSLEYSIMTYNSYVRPDGVAQPGYYTNEIYGFPQTYMMYDIAALQTMYGADFTFRATNTVYRWSPTTGETFVDGVRQGAPGGGIGGSANRVFLTIWDGGGKDTYDFSNYATAVKVNLAPGAYVALPSVQRAHLGDGHYARGNIFNALQHEGDARSLIENANGGFGSDTLTGNIAANTLRGGAGRDVLNGLAGKDALAGGSDSDIFVFNTPLGPTNVDRIADFRPVDDTIRLENSVFSALARTGTLRSGNFHTGGAAHDYNDRIIYNKATGAVLYDPDGTGSGAAVRFAQLAPSLAVTAADFFVI
jgi:serralysin